MSQAEQVIENDKLHLVSPTAADIAERDQEHPQANDRPTKKKAEFEWDTNNEDVIVPDQRATAVYVNRWGQAVIRQEKAWDEEDDAFVIVDRFHLPTLIARLQAIVDRPLDRDEPEPGQATG
jgi:hypothetical protein